MYKANDCVRKIKIDEIDDYRMSGKNMSDHNTIIVDIEIDQLRPIQSKITKWNINAPEEKWMLFREKLSMQKSQAKTIMQNKKLSITERYKKWEKLIYVAAMQSIGKTTCKARTAPKPSMEATRLRNERKAMKKRFEEETNYERKGIFLKEYILKQNELKARVPVRRTVGPKACPSRNNHPH